MAVRIEETGEQGFASKIDHMGGRAFVELFEFGEGADHENLAIFHSKSSNVRLCIIDGDDVATVVDRVGRVSWIRAAKAATDHDQQQDSADTRDHRFHRSEPSLRFRFQTNYG